MFDFVPLEIYTRSFYYVMLVLVVLVSFNTLRTPLENTTFLKERNWIGFGLAVIVVLFMGLRPVSGMYFADMITYANTFREMQESQVLVVEKDFVFAYFMWFCSRFMDETQFFLVCATLYVLPMYSVSKKLFRQYWFYAFLMFILSFSFWAYGTNGIRNGLATSVFLLGLIQENRNKALLIMAVSFGIHGSMMIPIGAYLLTLFSNNPLYYLRVWLLCIPLSAVSGGFWESFFLNLGIVEEDKIVGYLSEGDEYLDMAVKTGFRVDFLIYSAIGIGVGYYFIFKRKYEDVLYHRIFNIYLFANAFWVLLIRANFSNRFAYLSWFIMPLLIIYPFLKYLFFRKQHAIIGCLLVGYFAITFILMIVLGGI